MSRALPRVLGQTYGNLEIIIAAHGCTDKTVEQAKSIGDPRISVLEVDRRQTYPPTAENHWFCGPVAPANAALRVVRGDWIARIDDDDFWTKNHIEVLLSFALANNLEFVSSAYATHEKIIMGDGGRPIIGGTQTWLYRSYLKFMKYNPDCWRKSWNRVNDTDLAERFRRAGVRIGYTPDVTAYVYPRPGETDVGLKAYQKDAKNKNEHFAFR